MSSKLLLSLFIWFYLNTVFHLEQHFFPSRIDSFQFSCHVSNLIKTFQTYFLRSSTQYSLFMKNSCSIGYPVSCHLSFTSVLSHFISLKMIYFIIVFQSFSPTFLVPKSAYCRPPSHWSILCILQFSPFLYKIYSSSNVTFVIVILTILSHTNNRLAIQYNQRILLWKYIWILVQ